VKKRDSIKTSKREEKEEGPKKEEDVSRTVLEKGKGEGET